MQLRVSGDGGQHLHSVLLRFDRLFDSGLGVKVYISLGILQRDGHRVIIRAGFHPGGLPGLQGQWTAGQGKGLERRRLRLLDDDLQVIRLCVLGRVHRRSNFRIPIGQAEKRPAVFIIDDIALHGKRAQCRKNNEYQYNSQNNFSLGGPPPVAAVSSGQRDPLLCEKLMEIAEVSPPGP